MLVAASSVNLLFQQCEELGLGDAFLLHAVALAEREGGAGAPCVGSAGSNRERTSPK